MLIVIPKEGQYINEGVMNYLEALELMLGVLAQQLPYTVGEQSHSQFQTVNVLLYLIS